MTGVESTGRIAELTIKGGRLSVYITGSSSITGVNLLLPFLPLQIDVDDI